MRNSYIRLFCTLTVIIGLSPLLNAQSSRAIPLDMNLIIDGSASFQVSRNDAISWLNNQIVDPILIDGDNITVWRAGDSAEIIYSAEISGGKEDLKNALQSLLTDAAAPDFSGALTAAATRVSRVSRDRLSYTMLITASAMGLERALAGNARNLLRWSRTERAERWKVLVIGTDIGPRVRDAAAAYMSLSQ